MNHIHLVDNIILFDNILNNVQSLFSNTRWRLKKTPNKIIFNNVKNPLDEFVIKFNNNVSNIETLIPIDDLCYKQTFLNVNVNDNVNNVINYINMHVKNYDSKQ